MAHKCFISFKTEDANYKKYIQESLDVDMIDKSLDEAINSDNEDYIMQRIRQDYLGDSTVTIHLIGLHSSELLGEHEQRFIKRELQASLYNGANNSRSGILGVVLPSAQGSVYGGTYQCTACDPSHAINLVKVDGATVKEFSYNFYIPNGKCCHQEDDRYCVLVKWEDFRDNPEHYIDAAYSKRSAPIAAKVKVRP